jgi:hypothetical protein
VRLEGLGKFKILPHLISNPRPSGFEPSALTTRLPRAPLLLLLLLLLLLCTLSSFYFVCVILLFISFTRAYSVLASGLLSFHVNKHELN